MRSFLARAGHLLGRLGASFGLGAGHETVPGDLSVNAEAQTAVRLAVAAATEIQCDVKALTEINVSIASAAYVGVTASALTRIVLKAEVPVDVGDVARLDADFFVDGELTDPTNVSCRVKAPSGALTTFVYPNNIEKRSDGSYRVLVPCTEVGRWQYQWISTGEAAGAETGSFRVEQGYLQ